MQCAACDKLTPSPSTYAAMLAALIRLFPKHTSGYDAEYVHSTSWSTMARPVLSGTCPVKPLYGLGHRAAAQFQGIGIFIAYAIFM